MQFRKKQLILASLVLALGAAVYLTWQFTEPDVSAVNNEPVSESSELGVAQLVNNAYVETNTGETFDPLEEVKTTAATMSEARLSRQSSRDEAMEVLNGVLANADIDGEAREDAAAQASVIAQNILDESNVENLLEAKGFTDVVAYINGEACNVVISGDIDAADSLIIQEVVMEQTGFTADNIKMISTP